MNDSILLAFVCILVIGAASFLLRWHRRKPARCPVCARFGTAKHYGRVRCSACGTLFLLSAGGRSVRSIWQAAAGPICMLVYFALFALFVILCQVEPSQLWWAVLGGLVGVFDLRASLRRNEFVAQ